MESLRGSQAGECLTRPSLCSVDLQQQIMTIVDELGKASAKVRDASRRSKGKRVADKEPVQE